MCCERKGIRLVQPIFGQLQFIQAWLYKSPLQESISTRKIHEEYVSWPNLTIRWGLNVQVALCDNCVVMVAKPRINNAKRHHETSVKCHFGREIWPVGGGDAGRTTWKSCGCCSPNLTPPLSLFNSASISSSRFNLAIRSPRDGAPGFTGANVKQKDRHAVHSPRDGVPGFTGAKIRIRREVIYNFI